MDDSKTIGGFAVTASSLIIEKPAEEVTTEVVIGLSIGLFIAAGRYV